MLDTAEGILVGLTGCTIEQAFENLVEVSARHRVATLAVARALVELAENRAVAGTSDASAAVRQEWSGLFPAPTA